MTNKKRIIDFLKKCHNAVAELGQTMESVLACSFFSSWKEAKKIKRLNRQNKKKICYILGNGPSLKEVADTIQGSKEIALFAVNMMANNELFFKIKPENFLFVDPDFWMDEHPTIPKGTARYKEFIESRELFFDNMKKVDWEMNLFIPNNAPETIKEKFSPTTKIITFNKTPAGGFKTIRHFLYNQGLGMPKPINVIIPAIYCAIMAGYKEIDLFGINHSWMLDFRVDDNNRIYTKDSHFYENPEKERLYFNKGKLEGSLRCMADAFHCHTMLDIFAKTKNVKIYNCTKHSFVDAYEFKQI